MEQKKEMKEKVYKQSPVAICCYVFAAALLIYTFYMAGSTVKQVTEYYSSIGVSASAKEYFTYVIQTAIDPLVRAVLVFMAGYVLTAVRKLDPANYGEKKQTTSKAASAVAAKAKEARDDIAEAGDKVADKLDDVKKEAAEKIGDMKKEASDKIDEVKEAVTDKLEDVKAEAAGKAADVKEDASEAVSKASAAAKPVKAKPAKKKTQTAGKKAKEKGEELKDASEDKTEKL